MIANDWAPGKDILAVPCNWSKQREAMVTLRQEDLSYNWEY
jgi:hypothetical protein